MSLPPSPDADARAEPRPEPRPEPRAEWIVDAPPARPASPAPPSGLGRRLRLGVLVGAFAAAATLGVLVGFGWRAGAALRPFAALGRHALALGAGQTGTFARLASTVAGLALHVAVVVAWGVLFALVAARWRGWKRWAAAAATGLAAYLADQALVPEVWRLGDAPGVSPLHRATLFAVLALALALGMRVALSSSRPD